jgi:hypothetical protein
MNIPPHILANANARAHAQYQKTGEGPKARQRGGRGKRLAPGQMNRTEQAYAARLEGMRISGEVEWYKFGAVTFKLAEDTRLTCDFCVMLPDLTIEFVDTKGRTKDKVKGGYKPWIEDDAKLKMKVAAEMFPFRFAVVWPDPTKPGGWGRKNYGDEPVEVSDAGPSPAQYPEME